MGYRVTDIKMYKEDKAGVKPSSPKIVIVKNTSFDVKETQKSEDISFLGDRAANKTYGGYEYGGTQGFLLGGQYLPLIVEGVIGKATVVNATATSWKATTVVKVGDIVNLTSNKHSLVCYKAGTTGATEPSVTTIGNTLVDGTVTWILRPLLKKRTGKYNGCPSTFGIERKDEGHCGNAEIHYKAFEGVHFNSLELKKEGGEVKFESSQDAKCMNVVDSFRDSYTALGNGNALEEIFYSDNDLDIDFSEDGINWFKMDYLDSFSLSIQRDIEEKDIMDGTKRIALKNVSISGTASGLMRRELYEKSFLKESYQVRYTYSKKNGDKSIIIFTKVRFGTGEEKIEVGADILLDIELTGIDNKDDFIKYECITSLDI